MEVIDRLRTGFRESSTLMKIVWINVGVFVLLRLAAIVCVFSGNPDYIEVILSWVELPSSFHALITRPWTPVTYMFAQYDLLHLVFNMLWLYWFGTMFTVVSTPRQLLGLYFAGGLAGGLLYMFGYLALPMFHGAYGSLIGSSASVIAIVTAVAIMMPHFKMHLLFLGSVSVKWIAIATIALVLLGITGSNAGGEIAHTGGILAGVAYALWGRKIKFPLGSFRLRRSKVTPPPNSPTSAGNTPGGLNREEREELDRILDKIKKSGYSALTPSERDRLFNVSRKIR